MLPMSLSPFVLEHQNHPSHLPLSISHNLLCLIFQTLLPEYPTHLSHPPVPPTSGCQI